MKIISLNRNPFLPSSDSPGVVRRRLLSAIIWLGLCLSLVGQDASDALPQDVLDDLSEIAPATLTLVAPGAEPPAIVVGRRATDAEKFAARELSEHLAQITGQTVEIFAEGRQPEKAKIIAIGRSDLTRSYDAASLGPEQYIIDIKPTGMVIVGGALEPVVSADGKRHVNERGTLYGVYDFLESLGVRWYRPEPWGWYLPRQEKIELKVGMKTTSPPVFVGRAAVSTLGRAAHWEGRTAEDTRQAENWAARQRLNINASKSDRHGGFYRGDVTHTHTRRIVTPAEYLENHPEYFALVKGQRGSKGTGIHPQLCLGNPELQRTFASNVIRYAKDHPEAVVIPVDPEDGTQIGLRMCTCELCIAMDDPAEPTLMSNRVFKFTNQVAKEVAHEVPHVKLGLMAYSMHTRVPTQVDKLEANVVVGIATINNWNDWSKKLFDPSSPANVRCVELIRGWQALCNEVWMREYSTYAWVGPVPMYRILQDRVKSYRELKVSAIMWSDGNAQRGTQLLLPYLKAQLLWNPDLDLERELTLFYQNYYGPAAAPMRAYHEKWMDAFENFGLQAPGENLLIASGGRGMHLLCRPSLLGELAKPLQEAQQLVKGNALYERRLRGDLAGYEFCRRISEMLLSKLRDGKLKTAPLHPDRKYLESPTALEAWDSLREWMGGVNDNGLIFQLKNEKGVLSSVQNSYMQRDILFNVRYAGRDEATLLKSLGFRADEASAPKLEGL